MIFRELIEVWNVALDLPNLVMRFKLRVFSH